MAVTNPRSARMVAGLLLFFLLGVWTLMAAKRARQETDAARASQNEQAPAEAQKAAEPAARAPAAVQPPFSPARGEYAGTEACAACHDTISIRTLPHHRVVETNKRIGWETKACESCHGPGKAHAESADPTLIFSYKRATVTRANQACLSCHSQALRKSGHSFDAHTRNNISCVNCHSAHHAKQERRLLQEPTNELCASCHSSVTAEFTRPYKHELREGVVTCVDCHNPHGTPRRPQINQVMGNERGCFKCHGDKRGPFVFEHAPVKMDTCASCHEPHGSVNPRMLQRAEVRFQCLECHTNNTTALGNSPPAFHDLRSPRYQNCTSCHWKIHGSQANRAFLR